MAHWFSSVFRYQRYVTSYMLPWLFVSGILSAGVLQLYKPWNYETFVTGECWRRAGFFNLIETPSLHSSCV